MNDDTFFERRRALVAQIEQAAELEHALCCAYLFAAFSMKLDPDASADLGEIELLRRWKGVTLSVARQEMEHLAITSNLLTAIGEAPNLRRPDFPTARPEYPADLPVQLRRFGLEPLGDFLLYELPETLTPREEALRAYLRASPLPEDRALLKKLERANRKAQLESAYTRIANLFEGLRSEEARLFIGPPAAQVGNALVYETFPEVPNNERVYDVLVAMVTDTDSALAAVEQVQLEGEGSASPENPVGAHFTRFCDMYQQLSEAKIAAQRAGRSFEPARKVGPNPKLPGYAQTQPGKPPGEITLITDPIAVDTLQLYERAYTLMLKMLLRFFGMTDEDSKAVVGLQSVAFFPLMTLVMRPLGDMLADLPAQPGSDLRAGPAFDCGRDVAFAPHAQAAWTLFYHELMGLSEGAEALSKAMEALPRVHPGQPMHTRVDFMAQNFWRMAYNLADAVGMELPK